nr:hypothetical protein [Streptomyces sp. CRB46]
MIKGGIPPATSLPRISASPSVDTRLVVAAARPLPGNTADAEAWRNFGLAEHCQA